MEPYIRWENKNASSATGYDVIIATAKQDGEECRMGEKKRDYKPIYKYPKGKIDQKSAEIILYWGRNNKTNNRETRLSAGNLPMATLEGQSLANVTRYI